ncbi:MAG: hypothetical protein CMM50_02865 [Rhodospirillaceae bacterium]|nr:hypothetical protein [Rhodospirillaceae bacterium]
MSSVIGRLFGGGQQDNVPPLNPDNAVLSYDDAKSLARHADPSIRRRVAKRDDIPPEILYYLAADSDASVRREIALNASTPRQADLLLAEDSDEDVRLDVARKIGRLLPELGPNQQDRLGDLTLRALDLLSHDTLPRVRQALAEEIKRLPNVPRDVVTNLARDVELMVSAPILEFSPLLSDVDLLEIINSRPVQGALVAISRRQSVGEAVSSAIVGSEDEAAIAALLANPDAQIREETLDILIDRAPEFPSWHEPLVLRPHLSPRAISRISQFVAVSLLHTLQERHQLDPELAKKVADAIQRRLSQEGDEDPEVAQEVRSLAASNMLTDETILSRLGKGERNFIYSSLTLLSGLPYGTVRNVFISKSPKAVVTVCWQAGLSARTATELQLRGANIDPPLVLYAQDGLYYPLTEKEMRWRAELLES